MKLCKKCSVTKSDSDFHKCASQPDGLQWSCKACVKLYNDAHYRRIREADDGTLSRKNRNSHLQSKYGMSVDEWDALFLLQGETCAICGSNKPNGPWWHTDHCHDSEMVRAILCAPCNSAFTRHVAANLENMIAYRDKWKGMQ